MKFDCPIGILVGSSKLKQEFFLLNVILPFESSGACVGTTGARVYRGRYDYHTLSSLHYNRTALWGYYSVRMLKIIQILHYACLTQRPSFMSWLAVVRGRLVAVEWHPHSPRLSSLDFSPLYNLD